MTIVSVFFKIILAQQWEELKNERKKWMFFPFILFASTEHDGIINLYITQKPEGRKRVRAQYIQYLKAIFRT